MWSQKNGAHAFMPQQKATKAYVYTEKESHVLYVHIV